MIFLVLNHSGTFLQVAPLFITYFDFYPEVETIIFDLDYQLIVYLSEHYFELKAFVNDFDFIDFA